MSDIIKWGILAPGHIAERFAQHLTSLPNAKIIAVGSRSLERARQFAKTYNIERAYGSYLELANDPDIDIIYIASPHSAHYENCCMALECGKPVLCEKSFTVTAEQAKELTKLAREKKLFIMEAMWTRFLPIYSRVKELLDSKLLGEVQTVTANFCFHCEFDPQHRLYNPDLAGGALLDTGVYPISFAQWVMGEMPVSIKSSCNKSVTGVDEQTSMLLTYKDGKSALLLCAINSFAPTDAYINCKDGYLYIENFLGASKGAVYRGREKVEDLVFDYQYGLAFEAEEAMRCLKQGLIESPIMTHQMSIEVMTIMDKIRADNGIIFPFERT